MTSLRAIGTAGSASLLAIALLLTPALAANTQRTKANRPAAALGGRPVGAFTPAVSDPRLAAALARRGTSINSDFRFTPAAAAGERSRGVRVAVRARTAPRRPNRSGRLAARLGLADRGDHAQLLQSRRLRRLAPLRHHRRRRPGRWRPGHRHPRIGQVGMSYRATRRITGRVAVGAERAEGSRLIQEDQAYLVDVGGAFSIARNVDVTAGARYRIARDRLDPLRDNSRESQAVYVGTAFRF